MERVEKPHQTRLVRTIFALSIGFAFITAFIFEWHEPGMQVSIAAVLVAGIMLSTARLAERPVNAWSSLLIGIAVLLASFVPLRDNSGLIGLNILFSLLFFTYAAWEILKPSKLRLSDYVVGPITLPLFSLEYFPKGLGLLKLNANLTALSPQQRKVALGIAYTLPVLIVFGALLASADAIFADVVGNIFAIDLGLNVDELVARLLLFTAVLLPSASALLYILVFKKPQTKDNVYPQPGDHTTELAIVLSSLAILFAFFIVIQIVYLFGGREVVLEGSLTYAEYARSGFFELLAVSFLVFWLAFFVKRLLATTTKAAPKVLILTIIAEVGVIILSASQRLSLYEETFGFTFDRYLSHSFVFFLAIGFAVMAYTIVRHVHEERLLQLLVLAFGGYILMLNFMSPDSFVAQRNLERYQETGKLDGVYMSFLSEDALEQKIEAFELLSNSDDPEEQREAATIGASLCQRITTNDEDEHWSTFNVARARARSDIRELGLDCNNLGL